MLLLWPGLVILHVTKVEELVWPDSLEWAVLCVNGIVGVVLSNLLWLWSVYCLSVIALILARISCLAGGHYRLVSRCFVPGFLFFKLTNRLANRQYALTGWLFLDRFLNNSVSDRQLTEQ